METNSAGEKVTKKKGMTKYSSKTVCPTFLFATFYESNPIITNRKDLLGYSTVGDVKVHR